MNLASVEAAIISVFWKKVFLEISQNSQIDFSRHPHFQEQEHFSFWPDAYFFFIFLILKLLSTHIIFIISEISRKHLRYKRHFTGRKSDIFIVL